MIAQAKLFPAIAPLSPSHFTFVDNPKALAERDGLSAKACRGRLKRVDRRGAKLAAKREKAERYASLVSFYATNASGELSPFSDSDVADRLAELIARGADDDNSFIQY